MAIDNFIPELWAAMMLVRWENEKVFPALLDRHYEGIATKGNTVHISAVVKPQIKDYKAALRTTSPDDVSDTGVDLLIDQEKNWDIRIQDIDRIQAAGSLEDYTDSVADALVEDADRFIAARLVQDGNVLPYSSISTGDGAFNVFRDALKQLIKNKAPRTGLVAAVNPDFGALLRGADSKLTSFDSAGDTVGLRSGTIGQLLSFRVVETNNLPENVGGGSAPQAVFFHPSAAAYVSQIDSVEALRDNNSISDRFRGLHVYGAKVVRPEGVLVFNELGT